MNYPIILTEQAKVDIGLLKRENRKLGAKLWELVLDIDENPFEGLGKPEALKGNMAGWWSRRIDQKHRLIYRIRGGKLEIASCYGHYQDK